MFTGLLLGIGCTLSSQHLLLAQHASWILRVDEATLDVDSLVGVIARSSEVGVLLTHTPFRSPVNGILAAATGSPLDRYHVLNFSESVELTSGVRHRASGYTLIPNHRYSIAPPLQEHASKSTLDPQVVEWSIAAIDLIKAHDVTRGDRGVTIGILDTGLDFDHPAFRGVLRVNRLEDINGSGALEAWSVGETRNGVTGDLDGIDQDGNGYVDDVAGYDFVDQVTANLGDWSVRDGVPTDQQGHGTQVAGVVGGSRGVAPGCRILPLRAFDATGDGEDDDIAAAIVYAADNGVDILNFSFGDLYRSPLLADAVSYAESRGVLMVSSSGNNGIPDPHYPSGFSAVMSIGAIAESGALSVFSAYGSQISMVAPGENILTTTLGGNLRSVSGTSFAAPFVAGTAALMLSLSPRMSAGELRVALENSAKDRGPAGWDVDFGSGLLDADEALAEPAGGSLLILAPAHDSGVSSNGLVPVVGTVVGVGMTTWRMFVGLGETPELWELIGEGATGVIDDTLGVLALSKYPDSVVTVRLEAKYSDGRSNERRHRVYLDRSPPRFGDLDIHEVWIGARTGLFVSVSTDDLVYAELELTAENGEQKILSRGSGRTGLGRRHFWIVDPLEFSPGGELTLDVHTRNPAGLQSRYSEKSGLLTVTMPNRAAPTTSFTSVGDPLPYGYVDEPRASGTPFLILNRFIDLSFSETLLFSADGRGFDSVGAFGNWVPRGIGDTDGDGLLEALLQSTGTGVITEQNVTSGSLFASIIYADTTSRRFFPGAFFDVDGDGRDEIVGYRIDEKSSQQLLTVWRLDGGELRVLAEAGNPTSFPKDLDRNAFGASDVQFGDVNADGVPEFLTGDSDGDLLLYTLEQGNTLRLVWSRETDGIDADRMIAFADIDADGRDEVLFGTRSSPLISDDNEYEPPMWSLSGLRYDDAFSATQIFEESFAWPRSTSDFRTGINAGDLDDKPGDEVVMTLFPTAYIFRWDPLRSSLVPLYARDGSMGNDPFVLPRSDSLPARVLIGDGREYRFFALDSTSARLLPPAALTGWSLDQRTIFLRWSATGSVNSYRLFRSEKEALDDRFFLIAETDSTFWVDSVDLVAGTRYEYLVIAVGADETESRPANIVSIVPRELTRLVEAVPVGVTQMRLRFSAPLRQVLYRGGSLFISRKEESVSREVLSVITAGDSALLVTLARPAPGLQLTVRPTDLMRDRWLSPVDTTGVTVSMPEDRSPTRFFASSAEPLLERGEISITFSIPVDPASLETQRFTLSPEGVVDAVRIDPAQPGVVVLTPESGYPLGPFGYTYTIEVGDIRSADGSSLPTGPGSIVGFTITSTLLDSITIYPHPYSVGGGSEVLILSVPQSAEVSLYTQTGRLMREIGEGTGDGAVRWDGRDEWGETLLPGVYLVQVQLIDERGETTSKRLLKLAVTP